jgi:hypothetical protein
MFSPAERTLGLKIVLAPYGARFVPSALRRGFFSLQKGIVLIYLKKV